jgi:Protein of unknown function (DUF2510)
MAVAGWYPDPAGVPGRYRYWDGSNWSTVTSDDPRRPTPAESRASGSPPSEPSEAEPPNRPARWRRTALMLGVLAVAVSTVVAVAILIGNLRSLGDDPPTGAAASPSELASPARTPTATQSPSATPSPVPLVRCPMGNPNQRARHPIDSRVYGGNLSFEAQPTFEPAALEPRFSFAYDVLQQTLPVSQNWIAQLAVGQLRASDGFVHDARNTVESFAQCVVIGRMYGPYVPTRGDIRSESLSIDGRRGWLIESEITVDRPDLPLLGDHVIFIVVRDGKNWGFFFGAVPIGNAQLDAVLASTVRELRAS